MGQKALNAAFKILVAASFVFFSIIFLKYLITEVRAEGIEEITRSLLILGVLILAFLSGLISFYEYRGIGPQEGIIRHGSRAEKIVALTFDDGPNPKYTPKILDILRDYNLKATFFVIGRQVEKYPQLARRIVEEGHDIGNHSYSHCNLVLLSNDQLLKEIRKADQVILQHTGVKSILFRPPRGIYNNRVRQTILNENYRIVLWSVSALDWGPLGAKAIAFRVKRFTRNGSIILFHDGGSLVRREGGNRKKTINSLPIIIEHLKAEGYKIVPVSEMLSRWEEESCFDQVS